MEYAKLQPVLDALVEKYRNIPYALWATLHEEEGKLNDYSKNINADEPEQDKFWQAHTDVLEVDSDSRGRYALVSIALYPWGVHSIPPAPHASLLIYECGNCEIQTPWKKYSYTQTVSRE